MNKGFTLVEILIAVLIMGVLVTMAVPMYEKAVEKSRIAEVRTTLKRLYEAKRRALDNREQDENYTTDMFGFEHLDFSLACTHGSSTGGANNYQIKCSTKDFTYSLLPSGTGSNGIGTANMVCAARRTGDYINTNFLYQGEEVTGTETKLLCNQTGATLVGNACDVYGMANSGNTAFCTP